MKKPFWKLVIIIFAISIISWGYEGHQTIARIAENHLTENAKTAIKQLLGKQSITEVASWADEVRSQPEWKYSAPWHYVNVPNGLNESEFKNSIENSSTDNLLKAINKCEFELESKDVSLEQKAIALKFLIHLVGDAHQPMHVSRSEDKGGNTIQVQFDGKGTNLHALWDTRLIDHQGLSYTQLALSYDKAIPAEIARWQGTSPIVWMFESYQISTRLYAEVEQNNRLGEQYYQQHLGILEKRIEMAGIRLAGLLNRLFKNGLQTSKDAPSPSTPAAKVNEQPLGQRSVKINIRDAVNHYGENVTLTGKVFGFKDFGSLVLVNLGGPYPVQLLTVVLKGEAKKLTQELEGRIITVTGKLVEYRGKPEIVVNEPPQVIIGGFKQQ